jgi:16S rRNA (guanine527-N7)-methyltransferase
MIDYKTFEENFIFYFKQYDIEYDEKIINDFYIFTDYLLSENEKYNLTSIKNIDEIIVKHYIDSIIILKYFDIPENSKIIDIGTGAGFPALPLSIMRGDLRITFLDGSNKKINFIKNAIEKISGNPDNFIFYAGRAEDFGKQINIRETYDFAVSRAVAKLNILCELAAPFIKPQGVFIAYKSKNAHEEITEAKNALKILRLEITETNEFDLNGDNKRIFVKIKLVGVFRLPQSTIYLLPINQKHSSYDSRVAEES